MGLIEAAGFLNVKENPGLKKVSQDKEISRQHFMRRIGFFELIDGEYVGEIATLNFKCKATIKANPYRCGEADPEYVVVHSGAEVFFHDIGFAWERKTAGEHEYLRVQLDDPAFHKTIMAILVKSVKNTYNLFWDRISITEEDIERQIITEELIPWVGVYRPIDKVTPYLIEAYPSLKEIWDPD